MGSVARTIRLRDGRTLGYAEYGRPDGEALMHFHGHPGSRLEGALMHETARELGIRVLAVDRPGMGLSTFQPGRRLLDWPPDVAELADALGLGAFLVEGISGGAPFALACALAIPDRIPRVGLVAGLGPVGSLGTKGMLRANRVLFWLVRWAPFLVRPALWAVLGRHARDRGDPEVLLALGRRLVAGLEEADRAALADERLLRLFMQEGLEAFARDGRGAAQEACLYRRPWGFRLEDVAHPEVWMWHGMLDRHVPVRMAIEVAARLRGSHLELYDHDAHVSLALRRQREILETLCG